MKPSIDEVDAQLIALAREWDPGAFWGVLLQALMLHDGLTIDGARKIVEHLRGLKDPNWKRKHRGRLRLVVNAQRAAE